MLFRSTGMDRLDKYPDLKNKLSKELEASKACCGRRQAIIRKYFNEVQKRETRYGIENQSNNTTTRRHRLI